MRSELDGLFSKDGHCLVNYCSDGHEVNILNKLKCLTVDITYFFQEFFSNYLINVSVILI